MAELKKCPFCGGEAYSYKSKNLLGEMFCGIECESNECIVHTMIAEYPTEEKAIEQWNNRVTEAEIRNKAIDDTMRKLYELGHLHSRYLKSDIDEIAEQLKGE